MRPAAALSLAWIALALTGCAGVTLADYHVTASPPSGAATWRGLPIRTGQLVVNEAPGGTSLFLSLLTQRYAPYIHAGIVVVEDGEAYVYDAMGRMVPLPWRRPNAKVGGGVRRVTLEEFLERSQIAAIYEPPESVDREVLAEFARARWREKKPFDGRYDARDDERYYCVEFVARALEAAGGAPVPATRTSENPSVRVGLRWLGIDAPEFLLAGDLVAGNHRVALFSRRLTGAQVERYFVLKREIHRRFTDDQQVGSVLAWQGQRLRLRPLVDRYFEIGVDTARDVGELADEMFGAPAPRRMVTR